MQGVSTCEETWGVEACTGGGRRGSQASASPPLSEIDSFCSGRQHTGDLTVGVHRGTVSSKPGTWQLRTCGGPEQYAGWGLQHQRPQMPSAEGPTASDAAWSQQASSKLTSKVQAGHLRLSYSPGSMQWRTCAGIAVSEACMQWAARDERPLVPSAQGLSARAQAEAAPSIRQAGCGGASRPGASQLQYCPVCSRKCCTLGVHGMRGLTSAPPVPCIQPQAPAPAMSRQAIWQLQLARARLCREQSI